MKWEEETQIAIHCYLKNVMLLHCDVKMVCPLLFQLISCYVIVKYEDENTCI
jgi:hypothetical protein